MNGDGRLLIIIIDLFLEKGQYIHHISTITNRRAQNNSLYQARQLQVKQAKL